MNTAGTAFSARRALCLRLATMQQQEIPQTFEAAPNPRGWGHIAGSLKRFQEFNYRRFENTSGI